MSCHLILRGHGACSDWSLRRDSDASYKTVQSLWIMTARRKLIEVTEIERCLRICKNIIYKIHGPSIFKESASGYWNRNAMLMYHSHLLCFVLVAAGFQVKADALESIQEIQLFWHLAGGFVGFVIKFGTTSKSREKCWAKRSFLASLWGFSGWRAKEWQRAIYTDGIGHLCKCTNMHSCPRSCHWRVDTEIRENKQTNQNKKTLQIIKEIRLLFVRQTLLADWSCKPEENLLIDQYIKYMYYTHTHTPTHISRVCAWYMCVWLLEKY